MEKITTFTPAYDKRDPDPSKSYGIHGVDMRMVLKGELGAVQFVVYTGWHLKHVRKEFADKEYVSDVMPADLGYHSPTPMYEGQQRIGETRIRDNMDQLKLMTDIGLGSGIAFPEPDKVPEEELPVCEYIGKPCYYDGSGLNAYKVFEILTEKGSDGVWEYLEKYYTDVFGELK